MDRENVSMEQTFTPHGIEYHHVNDHNPERVKFHTLSFLQGIAAASPSLIVASKKELLPDEVVYNFGPVDKEDQQSYTHTGRLVTYPLENGKGERPIQTVDDYYELLTLFRTFIATNLVLDRPLRTWDEVIHILPEQIRKYNDGKPSDDMEDDDERPYSLLSFFSMSATSPTLTPEGLRATLKNVKRFQYKVNKVDDEEEQGVYVPSESLLKGTWFQPVQFNVQPKRETSDDGVYRITLGYLGTNSTNARSFYYTLVQENRNERTIPFTDGIYVALPDGSEYHEYVLRLRNELLLETVEEMSGCLMHGAPVKVEVMP